VVTLVNLVILGRHSEFASRRSKIAHFDNRPSKLYGFGSMLVSMTPAAPFASASLCVAGNLNRDLRIAPVAPGAYLFQDGETSVAFIRETTGGGGANTACAAAALGAKVAFLGRTGADALGLRLEQALRQQGVDPHLKRDPAAPTGTSINLVYDTGHRHFVSCLPNNESLAFEDLDLSVLPRYRHLSRTDVWFSEPMLYGGNQRLFRAARDAGLSISIDLNWDPQWGVSSAGQVERRKQAMREVLPSVDLVHGNVHELNEFAGCRELEVALRRIVDWGAGAIVVHMGAAGAGYFDGQSFIVEQACPSARLVNTTGTGDVLSVCMMLQHRLAIPVRDKLRLANRIVSEYMEGARAFVPVL
jgi:sugar/nucleoside kinase (ribokinase family)